MSSQDGGLYCSVCFEGYTEGSRRPVMLPACGHTFCRMCMSSVITKEREKGSFLCPTCRRPQPVCAAEDLPINYSLLEVKRGEVCTSSSATPSTARSSSNQSQQQQQDASQPSCPEHGSRLAFWCVSCEVAACGECLFDLHPRPDHDLLRLHDYFKSLQEMVRVRAMRLVSQLVSAGEENTATVRAALVVLVDHLRQRRTLDDLARRARAAREAAKETEDLSCVISVRDTIATIQRDFQEAAITTNVKVWVGGPSSSSTPTPTSTSSSSCATTPSKSSTPEKLYTPPQQDPLSPAPEMARGEVCVPINKPPVPVKPSLAYTAPSPPPASFPSPASSLPEAPFPSPVSSQPPASFPSPNHSPPPSHLAPSPPSLTPASTTSPPASLPPPSEIPASSPPKEDSPTTQSSPPGAPPLWPPILCGVLSGNWTSSRVALEPHGLHVYALQPMKDKCDLFVNMTVVSALTPLESPVVFLDLQDGERDLGRVYITLQSHLRRAQQFLSLCMGDRGPSYRGSFFHSVLRRNGVGEGLVGGDYEGKTGKGGRAIIADVEGELEVAKRCERGMVVRASSHADTAAQFSVMVRNGPRNKTVFPFGRVSAGLRVVEAACSRPALTVRVVECGCVLPV